MRLKVALTEGGANAAALYREITGHWGNAGGTIALSTDAALDTEMLEVEPHPTVWVEVPAKVVGSAEGRELVAGMHQRGFTLMLAGRPATPLPPELLPAFRMSVIHIDEDRRASATGPLPPGVTRSIQHVQDGVYTVAMMERCFALGASAIIGWPMEDALQHMGAANSNPDHATIIELIAMIDRGEDPVTMEKLLRRDASLAYRLLRYINSPGFGLSVEVQSFRHAVMMLGYTRLKRWLALSLATACKDVNMRPIMVASFRRGVFLEHLVGAEHDDSLRDEVFVLGVFSLLDKLLKQPFGVLFRRLHVPERVRETLAEGRGPYAPYLEVARTIERGPDPALQERLDACVLSIEQCNMAVLRALTAPDLVPS